MIESPTAPAAAARPALAPDQFHQGMVVQHPDYGLGKITAISGTGPKRSATILFASAAGERKFLLIHSRLTPAKGSAHS
jgi:DNA helicase-2/ATP-dependent DNA helicase PcrA